MQSSIAVKGIIINNNKVLILKRRPSDYHRPNTWDIPGGRLDPGEDPQEGLKREIFEETNITANIKQPLGVHSFTREDQLRITMLMFLCTANNYSIKLSEEHTEYKWASTELAKELLHSAHIKDIETYEKYFQEHNQV